MDKPKYFNNILIPNTDTKIPHFFIWFCCSTTLTMLYLPSCAQIKNGMPSCDTGTCIAPSLCNVPNPGPKGLNCWLFNISEQFIAHRRAVSRPYKVTVGQQKLCINTQVRFLHHIMDGRPLAGYDAILMLYWPIECRASIESLPCLVLLFVY